MASSEPVVVGGGFRRIGLREIDLNITNRCNLTCVHCAFASNANETDELSFARIQSLAEEARELGCREIHLTGGEPTLHPDCERIIDLLLGSGFTTRLISNGFLKRGQLEAYHRLGLRHVLFSMDGLAEGHDRIRGRRGAYSRTLRRTADAIELGFHVRVNAVAMSTNLDQLVPLFETCEDLGVQLFSVFLYSPTGRGAAQQLDLMVDPYRWRGVKEELRDRCSSSATDVFVEKGFLFLDEEEPPAGALLGRGQGCYSLSEVADYLLIKGNGDVYPCALLHDKGIPYGNIHHSRLKEILEHPSTHYRTYASFRQPSPECAPCEWWGACRGGCRALVHAVHGDWRHPDPQCRTEPGSGRPPFLPLCQLLKERLRGGEQTGFSEKIS
jgi:radical SAM protein with 4Fe4S-binding SPASM domain